MGQDPRPPAVDLKNECFFICPNDLSLSLHLDSVTIFLRNVTEFAIFLKRLELTELNRSI